MKTSNFSGSIGSQIMIAQQQYRHQKRLDEIYNKAAILSPKTVNVQYLMRSSNRNPLKMSKKMFNEEINHHLTLRHLIKRLNSPKSYQDRLKDENDFLAYPALFFRKNSNSTQKKKSLKPKKKAKTVWTDQNQTKVQSNISHINPLKNQSSSVKKNPTKGKKTDIQQNKKSPSVNSEYPHNGLTLEKVMNELPNLQKFEQQDVEMFADHLTRIIFKYNLNSMDDIEFLFQCIEEYLPEHYPENFVNAIQDMFREIVNSLNIEE